MKTNNHVNALLLFYQQERDQARAEELERRLIPHQASRVKDCQRLNLPYVADLRIMEGMKREYKALTGREYA